MILNQFLKFFIIEERPDSIIKPILEHVPDNSFPSDHATVSFAFLF
jgi:membrane-associated phospholipid phosphatase